MEAVQFLQKELLPEQFKNIFENNFDDVGFMKLTTNPWSYDKTNELLTFNPQNGSPKQYISLKRSSKNWDNFLLAQSNPFFSVFKMNFTKQSFKSAIMDDKFVPTWQKFNAGQWEAFDLVEDNLLQLLNSTSTSADYANKNPLYFKQLFEGIPTWKPMFLIDFKSYAYLHGMFHEWKIMQIIQDYIDNNPIYDFNELERHSKQLFPFYTPDDPLDGIEYIQNKEKPSKEETELLELYNKSKDKPDDRKSRDVMVDNYWDADRKVHTSTATDQRVLGYGDEKIYWTMYGGKKRIIAVHRKSPYSNTTKLYYASKWNTNPYKDSPVKSFRGETTKEFEVRNGVPKPRTGSLFETANNTIVVGSSILVYKTGNPSLVKGLGVSIPLQRKTQRVADPFQLYRSAYPQTTDGYYSQQFFKGQVPNYVLRKHEKEFTYTNTLAGIVGVNVFWNVPVKLFLERFQGKIYYQQINQPPKLLSDSLEFKRRALGEATLTGNISGINGKPELKIDGSVALRFELESRISVCVNDGEDCSYVKDAWVLRDDANKLTTPKKEPTATLSRSVIHSEFSWQSLSTNTDFVSVKDLQGVVFDHNCFGMVSLFLKRAEMVAVLISCNMPPHPLQSVVIVRLSPDRFWIVKNTNSRIYTKRKATEIPANELLAKRMSQTVLEFFNQKFKRKMGGKIFQATFYKKVKSAWTNTEREALQGQTDAIRDQKRPHTHTYSGYDYKGMLIKNIQCTGDLVDFTKRTSDPLRETEKKKLSPSVRQMLGLSQRSTVEQEPENEICALCGTNTKLNERVRNLLPKLNINIHR